MPVLSFTYVINYRLNEMTNQGAWHNLILSCSIFVVIDLSLYFLSLMKTEQARLIILLSKAVGQVLLILTLLQSLSRLLIRPVPQRLRAIFISAIAAGDNSLIASGVSTDLDGNPRISHGTVNMGAYEGDLVPATNKVPTIAGSPETSVTANTAYSFTPTANDDEGETLTFSITGKPDWADFDTSTGKIAAHNEWRQQVSVDGLTWHSELANAAQTWANTLQEFIGQVAFQQRQKVSWIHGAVKKRTTIMTPTPVK